MKTARGRLHPSIKHEDVGAIPVHLDAVVCPVLCAQRPNRVIESHAIIARLWHDKARAAAHEDSGPGVVPKGVDPAREAEANHATATMAK